MNTSSTFSNFASSSDTTIIRNFAHVLEHVLRTDALLYCYPADIYPESLLADPKPVIKEALLRQLEISKKLPNALLRINTEHYLRFIDQFVPDRQSHDQNMRILLSPGHARLLDMLGKDQVKI